MEGALASFYCLILSGWCIGSSLLDSSADFRSVDTVMAHNKTGGLKGTGINRTNER